MVDDTLLAAHELTRYYHGRKVLHGIDLELRRGEVLGFLGPNGAGKSTTMNILCGVLAPHGGKVNICGYDLAREPLRAKRQIGYLPERPPLHLDATVDEYLRFCAEVRGLRAQIASAAVDKAKHDCDLGEVAARLIGNLSKGFRQRVGIAQALLHQLIIIRNIPCRIRSVRNTIRDLARHHAVVLSTHVLSEAQALCSRVAILHHGRIAFNRRIGEDPDVMSVRFADVEAAHDWERIDGVTTGEPSGPGRYRLRVTDFDLAAEAVCRLAIERGWGLRELTRDTSPLEQVFVDLTCNDVLETA